MASMFASMLPGLIAGGKSFLGGTVSDILSGKNVLQSIGSNAVNAIDTVLPGAGGIVKSLAGAVGGLFKKKPIDNSRMAVLDRDADRLLKGKAVTQVQGYLDNKDPRMQAFIRAELTPVYGPLTAMDIFKRKDAKYIIKMILRNRWDMATEDQAAQDAADAAAAAK